MLYKVCQNTVGDQRAWFCVGGSPQVQEELSVFLFVMEIGLICFVGCTVALSFLFHVIICAWNRLSREVGMDLTARAQGHCSQT